MKRASKNFCNILYQTENECNWIDKFGEHFEVRQEACGKIFSRKITRDEILGWTVTWDEVRTSVLDSLSKEAKEKAGF